MKKDLRLYSLKFCYPFFRFLRRFLKALIELCAGGTFNYAVKISIELCARYAVEIFIFKSICH